MAERFSLNDHLFNESSVGQLAGEYAAAVPGFDPARFRAEALSGFAKRELMARLDWIADCIEAQLPTDFSAMAEALEAAMPPPLDPSRQDDDFGQFIHAVPGILAVRHGLEAHRERALDLLYAATQRFSMEFYIRPFLNRWPEETLARLAVWVEDANYHVRRLVSEGTRPKLPWAKAVSLMPTQALPLLDRLHADRTRYVTRSVANHLNDLSKTVPDQVLERLAEWRREGRQEKTELDWMTRHALRTLIKQGHPGAMEALGYRRDLALTAAVRLLEKAPRIGGTLVFEVDLRCAEVAPLLVDYRISFARPGGRSAEKVFKLGRVPTQAEERTVLVKRHPLKGNATTFTLHPGPHRLTVQVNGLDVAQAAFELSGR